MRKRHVFQSLCALRTLLRQPVTSRIAIIFLACLLILINGRWSTAQQSLWTESSRAAPASPTLVQFNQALQQLAASVLPAVVSLKVHANRETAALPDDHPNVPGSQPQTATGSGFIIRADGLVVTNDHVVEDGIRIDVQLYGGETMEAKVVGRDPVGDLALLKLRTNQRLPVVPLGRSSALQVGEFVAAFGSPFGFEHTMTFGVVSAIKRRFMRSGIVGGYIQTDASINTGNSGGPLVNMHGAVVGLNTATVGRGELGFAIPIDAIKSVLPQLHQSGDVRRGWLGVQIRPLDGNHAREAGLDPKGGVYVLDVLNDQPAHRAGIIAGDVITQFNGAVIQTPLDLQSAVASTPVGTTVRIQLVRKKAQQVLQLTVGEMPTESQ
ncbi:S1C family serine protease [Candidatus Entotheonella palauensis]|nr:trypsin-like peptidase domain-containing protein [Candidatus Entotheonella palauensis]